MTSAFDNLPALIDEMLQDAGFDQDADLRGTLLSLGALAALPAPVPTGELAALLSGSGPAGEAVSAELSGGLPGAQVAGTETGEQPRERAAGEPDDELARRRRSRATKPTALGLVLVAGMGLGVGGVAASSTGSSALSHLVEEWVPWRNSTSDVAAAGTDQRAPSMAAEEWLRGVGFTHAPGAAPGTGKPAFGFLQDPANLSSYAAAPFCAGPVKQDSGPGQGKCAGGPPRAAPQARGTGGSKDGPGPAAPEGVPPGPGVGGAGKAGTTPDGPAAGTDGAAAARQAAGLAAVATKRAQTTGPLCHLAETVMGRIQSGQDLPL